MNGISAKAIYSPENRIKYNGYELNDNFDLNLYESFYRVHDPQIGRWWQIDPKPNNSESPFVAMGNNPISQMDLLGDTLRISFKTGFLGLGGTRQVTYNDGSVTNIDGTAYTGKVKGFLKKAINAVNQITRSNTGAGIVNELENSASNYTIVKGDGNGYTPSGRTIKFNPSSSSSALDTRGSRERPAFLGLAHEMAHAVDHERGTLNTGLVPGQSFAYAEQFATHMENKIRADLFIPLRAYYGHDETKGAGFYPIISSNMQSLFYNGYDYYKGVQAPAVRAAPLLPVQVPPLNSVPTINIKIR